MTDAVKDADNPKNLQTILDRGGRPLREGVQHKNNGMQPKAAVYVLGGIAVMLGLFWLLGKAAVAPGGGYVAAKELTVTPTHINVVAFMPTIDIPQKSLRGAATPVNVASTLVPSPEATATVPATIVPAPTTGPDVLLVVRSYWPKKGWGNARTKSGADPASVAGLGLACPDNFPLGTRFHLDGGSTYLCVDRAGLRCGGGMCSVVLYTKQPLVSVVVAAWVEFPVKDWSVKP